MDDDGPCPATALLPLRPGSWPSLRFLLSGVGGSTKNAARLFDKGREAVLLAETVQLFDKEKTRQEGSCLMQLRAVPFQDVPLVC